MLTRAPVSSASRAPKSAVSAGPLSSVAPRANQRRGPLGLIGARQLERRRPPAVARLRRLHVEVVVDRHRRQRRVLDEPAEQHREAAGVDHVDARAGLAQVAARQRHAGVHLGAAAGIHADGGDADQRRQPVLELGLQIRHPLLQPRAVDHPPICTIVLYHRRGQTAEPNQCPRRSWPTRCGSSGAMSARTASSIAAGEPGSKNTSTPPTTPASARESIAAAPIC